MLRCRRDLTTPVESGIFAENAWLCARRVSSFGLSKWDSAAGPPMVLRDERMHAGIAGWRSVSNHAERSRRKRVAEAAVSKALSAAAEAARVCP